MLLSLWKLTPELLGFMGRRGNMLIFKANGAANAGASPAKRESRETSGGVCCPDRFPVSDERGSVSAVKPS